MADGRGRFQPLVAQVQSRWLFRTSVCLLSAACSAAALLALGGGGASLRLRRGSGAGLLRGAPAAALFSADGSGGGGGSEADVHCEEVMGRASYAEDRLLARSGVAPGAVESYAAAKSKVGAVSPFYGAHAKGDAWGGGILDFSVGGKNPHTHGVLNWQGAGGAQQEFKSIAQFRDAFQASAAGGPTPAPERSRLAAAVSPFSGRMLDQCRQLSDNNIIADAVHSRDGEVLDLTFKYVLLAGRDVNSTRPLLQHAYWAPNRCASCSTPFAGDAGGRPSASLPARMEPGIMYTFHCVRSKDCDETVDVSVVTDAGLFQAEMPPVQGRPVGLPMRLDTPPPREGHSAEGGAESGRQHREDVGRLGGSPDAYRAALASSRSAAFASRAAAAGPTPSSPTG